MVEKMKSYSDLAGDGGSNIMAQVVAQKDRIAKNLSSIKHMIAIGSGKGGVGKSTLTMQLAGALNHQGFKVSLLDADVNGPSLARLSGLRKVRLVPGNNGLTVPKTKSGIGVISFGSVVPETEAVDFKSVATGESHIWRATKEFSTLAQFLEATDWGVLDFLLIDLPPGAERIFQFAEFFGENTKFIFVTIPSEVSLGVVSRSIAALRKTTCPILGIIYNMDGYYCSHCKEVRPLFPLQQNLDLNIPLLGRVPFDPELAKICDEGKTIEDYLETPAAQAIDQAAKEVLSILERG